MAKDLVLNESQERYQAFLRNSQEGIWRVELEEPIPISLSPKKQIERMYKYAYLAEANVAMARMYGFKSPKLMVGARLNDLLIEDDPANTEYLTAFIKSNYNLSGVESHEIDKFGKERYFRNSLVGIVENGKVLRAWGTQQDVTEQHEASLAQRKSEARLKMALKVSRMGTWEWDIKTNELMWSDELKAIFGLKQKEEVTYEKYLKLIHPKDRLNLQKTIKEAMKKGDIYQIEHRIIRPDGTIHWVLGQGQAFKDDGKVDLMIGTSMLIDERKEIESRLIESEERFRNMADTAPVYIWMSHADGQRFYFNHQWLEATGRSFEHEEGMGWAKGIHRDDFKRYFKIHDKAYSQKEPFSIEYRLRRADGGYRWTLLHAAPRFAPHGEFLGYIGTCTDVEDFKNAIQRSTELEISNAQLLQLNEAKDEFISIASHQLRTPATGVKQYVGMVLDGYAGTINDEQRNMLNLAYDSNERQINIINDLLRVAHVDAGKIVLQPETCDITHLVRDVIEEQKTKFARREQSIVFVADENVNCIVDGRLLRMVIENLIDNAGKYSPVRSRVEVSIKQKAKEVEIAVKDFGIGIDQEDQKKLFQKFSRIQNHLTAGIEGTGLGLYWSKQIIDLHKGKISLKSKLNSGTTFTLKLPLDTNAISKA